MSPYTAQYPSPCPSLFLAPSCLWALADACLSSANATVHPPCQASSSLCLRQKSYAAWKWLPLLSSHIPNPNISLLKLKTTSWSKEHSLAQVFTRNWQDQVQGTELKYRYCCTRHKKQSNYHLCRDKTLRVFFGSWDNLLYPYFLVDLKGP